MSTNGQLKGAMLTDTDLRKIVCRTADREVDSQLQIYPFAEDSLTPVGYDLRVGRRYTSVRRGETKELSEDGQIDLPPQDTCLIATMEVLGMPKDRSLGGMIVSTVTMVAKGLSHVSTSVDPDWSGRLMIVLHNHSRSTVTLKVGSRICTAIFFPTASPSTKECGVYAERDDILRKQLIEETARQQRRRRTYLVLLLAAVIPISAGLGYMLFRNGPGMIAMTSAGIALLAYFKDRWA